MAGRGAAPGQTDSVGIPEGRTTGAYPWNGPSRAPDVRAQATPPPLTVRGAEARPEFASSEAEGEKAGGLDPGAYRHENNDRTGSAWGWASGSPSRQTSLSRNLGGTVFSLGVQFRYGSGMEEQA